MSLSRRRWALACASILAITVAGVAAPSAAQSAAQATRAYEIPAGALGPALNRFASETGLALVYPAELAQGRQTQGFSGSAATDEALARLLAGTGLVFHFSDTGAVMIAPDSRGGGEDGRVLGAVRVEGQTGAGYNPPTRGDGIAQLGGIRGRQDDEAIGYRARVATAGSGVQTAIEDVPRSISVLTQEQIEKQDIFDFRDAMKRLPGVTFRDTTAQSSGNAKIFSRGYAIDTMQIDGGPAQTLYLFGNGTLDLSAYERVELVSGPNGSFMGAGASPGGSLNLVRKRPSDQETLQITTTLGSFNRRQALIDYSTPSLLNTNVAFRGILNAQDTEFFYWNASKENLMAYGMLDAPVGDQARLEFGGRYSKVRETATYSGIGRYSEGPSWDVPYEFNMSDDLTYNDGYETEVFGRLYLDIADQWDVQVGFLRNWGYYDKTFRASRTNGDPTLVKATGKTIAETLTPGRLPGLGLRTDGANLGVLQADLRLNGKLSTWGLDHSLFLSADYSESYMSDGQEKGIRAAKPIRTLADYYPDKPYLPLNEFYRMAGLATVPGYDTIYTLKKDRASASSNVSIGVTAQDVISFRDWADLSVQLRWFTGNNASAGTSFNTTSGEVTYVWYNSSKIVGKIRPSYGLTLKPTRNLRVVASYSEGFNDQGTMYGLDRRPLDPSTYENIEGGVKWANDRLYVSLTAYDQNRRNTAEAVDLTVPGSRDCPPTGSSTCYYRTGASQRTRGVDFKVNGELIDGLQVIAAYNYNENEQISTNQPLTTEAPAESASIWLEWTPQSMPQLSLRGGAEYRSRIYVMGQRYDYAQDPVTGVWSRTYLGDFEIDEPAVTTWDLGGSYAFNDNLVLDLFIENLFDKRYFATQYALATPRTITATLRYKSGLNISRRRGDGFTIFGEASDWYASGQVGGHSLSDMDLEGGLFPGGEQIKWKADTKGTAAALFTLGYRFTPNVRGEFELGFRKGEIQRVAGGTLPPNAVCSMETGAPAAPACDDASGDLDTTTFMANALYDFGSTDSAIRPYVGFGLGGASVSADFGGRLNGVTVDTDFGSQTQKTVFAWQALAGVGWKLTDRLTVDATYRYLSVPSLSLDGFAKPQYQDALSSFDTEYSDSTVSVGVRWAFGVKN